MSVSFESKEMCALSEKELFIICKRLNRKKFTLMNILTGFAIMISLASLLSLLYKWNWLFVLCIVGLVDIFYTYKNMPLKFKQRLLRMPSYHFADEYFCVGDKQFQYSDVEVFEMGGDFARIKMGKYKLILIFVDKDKKEIDMLVTKLRARAKRYKEV